MHMLCRAFTAQMIIYVSLASASAAQPVGNSKSLQKKLEGAAARLQHEDLGPVKARSATVGDHMLIIDFEPATGVDGSLALKNMRELSWEHAVCSNKEALEFIKSEAVTVRITLSRASLPTDQIADVTAISCAREATVDPGLSRVIGGGTFAPKPSPEAARAQLQAYLKQTLFDVDSAKIECGNVGPPGWVKPVLQARRYGYFLRCNINAKNAYGGYVGFREKLYRINGDEFEEITFIPEKVGLMDSSK